MLNQKILITGGTGFIGRNLIKLLNDSYSFINIGRNENNICKNIFWNLKDNLNHNIIPDDISIIIHCAAIVGSNSKLTKADYIDINVKSTLYLLELAINKKIPRFIYVSSAGVYGYKDNQCYEDDNCEPFDIYGVSKYMSELICNLYNNSIDITILRPFFPYGEDQKGRFLQIIFNNLYKNKSITLNQSGLPRISPIYITDLIKAIKLIIEKKVYGTYNISGIDSLSIQEICDFLIKTFNLNDVQYKYTNIVTKNLMGDNRKLNNIITFHPQISLKEGLKRCFSNYISNQVF